MQSLSVDLETRITNKLDYKTNELTQMRGNSHGINKSGAHGASTLFFSYDVLFTFVHAF